MRLALLQGCGGGVSCRQAGACEPRGDCYVASSCRSRAGPDMGSHGRRRGMCFQTTALECRDACQLEQTHARGHPARMGLRWGTHSGHDGSSCLSACPVPHAESFLAFVSVVHVRQVTAAGRREPAGLVMQHFHRGPGTAEPQGTLRTSLALGSSTDLLTSAGHAGGCFR